MGHPQRHVIALAGDGAMQMNGLNALITTARYSRLWGNPKLTIAVLNNRDLRRTEMGTSNNQETAGKRNPGDEAAPGTEQKGETSCPVCHGNGKTNAGSCTSYGRTGLVIVTVGDA